MIIGAVVVLALLFASPSTALRPTLTHNPCPRHVSPSAFQEFAESVWRLPSWERGPPKATTIAAAHHQIYCARGTGHRGLLKHWWREAKRAFYEHRAYKLRWGDCSDSGPVPDCIHGAALTYGADEGWMLRVSYCESRWDRFAVNGSSGSTGLFQFIPSTWKTTPFGSKSIWSAKWQSLAAAWMEIHGRAGEWVCQG